MKQRCEWCGDDPLYVQYHDGVWGVPLHDDRTLFEMLILEGRTGRTQLDHRAAETRELQGRLLITSMRRRSPTMMSAKFGELMNNPGIIRNRLKINAAITNARAYPGSTRRIR